MSSLISSSKYANASREELLARITDLESTLQRRSTASPGINGSTRKLSKQKRKELLAQQEGTLPIEDEDSFFDRYPTRKIALKFCYQGWPYGGLAIQNEATPLPTVEGMLLEALIDSKLIKHCPLDAEDLHFGRCGRTDRGVSSAGQVVSLYVRSQLDPAQGANEIGWRAAKTPVDVMPKKRILTEEEESKLHKNDLHNYRQTLAARSVVRTELPYISLINRILPESIRILAWCPVEEEFDARFSCIGRYYKYLFSSSPKYGQPLDIKAMQIAAQYLVGEQDFRNLCKIDPTKQINNYRRRVISAEIEEIPSLSMDGVKNYVFNLKGQSFLYHQVRHIMAILFLVGSGKEKPDIVKALTNTGYGDVQEDRKDMPLVPSKPAYEMADDLPLVLWDCFFPEGSVKWRQESTSVLGAREKLKQDMYQSWTRYAIKAAITQHFIDASETYDRSSEVPDIQQISKPNTTPAVRSLIQLGGGDTLKTGKYRALLDRVRSERVEVTNLKWAEGQGKRRQERKAAEAESAKIPEFRHDGAD